MTIHQMKLKPTAKDDAPVKLRPRATLPPLAVGLATEQEHIMFSYRFTVTGGISAQIQVRLEYPCFFFLCSEREVWMSEKVYAVRTLYVICR